MKKVLTILVVLALVAGFAFADGNTVTLTTSIGEIAPAFKLYYDKAETGEKADFLVGTQAANSSIADGVVAKFVIWQEGEEGGKTYSNYKAATVELTVTCGAFVGKTGTGTEGYASATPKASALANGDAQEDTKGADTLTYGEYAGTDTNVVTFKPTYHGKRVDDQKIASFTATWAAADSLPFGDYTADITLAYTAD